MRCSVASTPVRRAEGGSSAKSDLVRVRVRVRVSVSVRVGVLGAYVERAAAKQPALHLQHTAAPATSAAAAATSFAAAATAASAALSIIIASAALVGARLGAASGLHLDQG